MGLFSVFMLMLATLSVGLLVGSTISVSSTALRVVTFGILAFIIAIALSASFLFAAVYLNYPSLSQFNSDVVNGVGPAARIRSLNLDIAPLIEEVSKFAAVVCLGRSTNTFLPKLSDCMAVGAAFGLCEFALNIFSFAINLEKQTVANPLEAILISSAIAATPLLMHTATCGFYVVRHNFQRLHPLHVMSIIPAYALHQMNNKALAPLVDEYVVEVDSFHTALFATLLVGATLAVGYWLRQSLYTAAGYK